MSSKCRFPSCKWSGDVNDIFDHCESHHSKYIKETDVENKIPFTFDDIFDGAFLLNASGGLYWFLLDPIEHKDCVRRGLFAIGESEKCEYTLKIGSINTDFRYDIVDKIALSEDSDQYELVWPFDYLESMEDLFKSKEMAIYFGGYNKVEEYTGMHLDVDWSNPEEVEYNEKCLEKFTCPVCFEYIRSNAISCENRHFVCKGCLDKMTDPKCPQCREGYPYDCIDEKIEELLKCVRFPTED